MEDYAEDHMQDVVGVLSEKMKGFKEDISSGVVFVLGAGCSMQYGLPSFEELLRSIYREIHPGELAAALQLPQLRKSLDTLFRYESARVVRHVSRYLGGMNGRYCRGYRDLARVVQAGYVRAIVNMNFDNLLIEALEEEFKGKKTRDDLLIDSEQWPRDGTEPSGEFRLITPHGSLARPERRLTLDIVSSDLFNENRTEVAAQAFFQANNVVVVGYSGGDAKMSQVLKKEKAEQSRTDGRELFVFNLTPPEAHLARAGSGDLYVTGAPGTFENLMAALRTKLVSGGRGLTASTARGRARLGGDFAVYFSREEQEALEQCRRFALRTRSSLNVAEASKITIDEHAHSLFNECLGLSAKLGCTLTTSERYLVYCACFLHDLGYFAAYSTGKANEMNGWDLLRAHGGKTAELLEARLDEENLKSIAPGSFTTGGRDLFKTLLVYLCKYHSFIVHFAEEAEIDPKTYFGEEYEVPVRFNLVHKLFVAAEELSQGHPFSPSPYPFKPEERAIQDPILDIYLAQKHLVTFDFDTASASAIAMVRVSEPDPGGRPFSNAAAVWFCTMAEVALTILREAVIAEGIPVDDAPCLALDPELAPRELGKQIQGSLDEVRSLHQASEASVFRQEVMETLRLKVAKALIETLAKSIDEEVGGWNWSAEKPGKSDGRLAAALDLITLYTSDYLFDPERKGWPAGDFNDAINGHLTRLRISLNGGAETSGAQASRKRWLSDHSHSGLPALYFERHESGDTSDPPSMVKEFRDVYRRIYYPAWRFCAEHWRSGNDVVCMARAALDFGSSCRRGEVIAGLEHLVREKIDLGEKVDGVPRRAFGHGRCMLCTGRLLYILSCARLLFHEATPEPVIRADQNQGKTLGLIHFMLDVKDNEPSWWGMGGDQIIRSADYIAWGLRGLGMAILTNALLKDEWLPPTAWDLFQTVLGYLKATDGDQLFGDRAEEPRSFVLGEVATTYLCLEWMDRRMARVGLPKGQLFGREVAEECVEKFRPAFAAMKQHQLSLLDNCYALPALLFMHEHEMQPALRRGLAKEAVEIATLCAQSGVWIKERSGRGSWGNNLENTQRLVSCLSVFWRYAFDEDNEEEFKEIYRQRTP